MINPLLKRVTLGDRQLLLRLDAQIGSLTREHDSHESKKTLDDERSNLNSLSPLDRRRRQSEKRRLFRVAIKFLALTSQLAQVSQSVNELATAIQAISFT